MSFGNVVTEVDHMYSGILMVKEAGGIVIDFDGNPFTRMKEEIMRRGEDGRSHEGPEKLGRRYYIQPVVNYMKRQEQKDLN